MVFQDPSAALNPAVRVGEQVTEGLAVHRGLSRRERRVHAVELLRRVGLPDPEVRVDAWPHELSGGQRQRVCIAMALACGPRLLVADEPTGNLDPTLAAEIMQLFAELPARGTSVLVVSHDLALLKQMRKRVLVLDHGRLVDDISPQDLAE